MLPQSISYSPEGNSGSNQANWASSWSDYWIRSFEVVLMLELSLWLGLVCVVGLTAVIGIEKGLEITRRGFKP